MDIVYSAQKRGFVKGRTYQNPRFFQGTLAAGATRAIVVGEWPAVVQAYEEAGIPVVKVPTHGKLPEIENEEDLPRRRKNVSRQVTTEHPDSTVDDEGNISPSLEGGTGTKVEIPTHPERMNFKNLRALVQKIDPEADIATKAEALEIIEKYQNQ